MTARPPTASRAVAVLGLGLVTLVYAGCSDDASTADSDASNPANMDALDIAADSDVSGEADVSAAADAIGLDPDADGLEAQDVLEESGTFTNLGTCDVADVLANPNNAVAGATCHRAEVICEGLDPIELTMLVGRPPEGTPVRGVVTFSSGTGGTTFYNAAIAQALVDEGFITIRRRWSYDWVTGPGGMRRSSCRFTTMMTWLRSREWAEGKPLCATGNSGGATEISYGLSAQSLGAVLDLAVVTGGPPMGRVDLGCLGGAAWESQCHNLVPSGACPAEDLRCGYGPAAMSLIDSAYEGTPCADAATSGDTEILQDDSVVSPLGIYDYPQTLVHVIQGNQDCSEAAPLGMLYAEAVTSEKVVEWVEAPHGVFQSSAGKQAIRAAILDGCVSRH